MATNINITQPPEFLQNYYAALAERGMNLGNLGFTPYDQTRVAPWTQPQQDAAALIQQRALSGSPAMQQAGQYFSNTLAGKNVNPYMGDNPYLKGMIDTAAGDITSRINSQFSNNAFGGTAHQQTLARELGNMETQIRGADYGQQRQLAENQLGRQQSALGFAPTLAANDYADASALMGLGTQLQGTNQQIADANYQEFLRQQAFPGQQLGFMAQGIGAAGAGAGGTQTSTSNTQGSPLAGALGGGLAGYGIANVLKFENPWWGAGLGALGGGLLAGR